MRPGGCSGFSYEMFFDGDVAADDEQARFGDDGDVQVVVDPASAQLLEGATLDYKDGLDQSRVRHHEPQRHPHVRVRPELLLNRPIPAS